jgi:hypothetical protein
VATGWGRGTWGSDYFGATSVDVSVTGNVGTLALGDETVTAEQIHLLRVMRVHQH